jgi:hypothetical protein
MTAAFLPTFFAVTAPPMEHPPCGATRFRWATHIALPYTLPSRGCIHQKICLDGREYEYSIHNYLDRLTIFPDTSPAWPAVRLVPRSEPAHLPHIGWRFARETLQSVACFVEVAESSDPNEPFVNAIDKVNACFRYLSDHLAKLQRAMPYLSSWQIYPISQFDVGLVYHRVEHFCPALGRWTNHATGAVINMARLAHQPFSYVDFSRNENTDPAVDLCNELLAEAQVSSVRGLYRSALLNSYQATESLANVVFKVKFKEKLRREGSSETDAEQQAEDTRMKHRVDIKFLVHSGLISACGSSLYNEQKEQYDELCELNKLRGKVAHAGTKPTQQQAEEAHLLW